ncbi:DNA lyase [Actinomyces sp. oral taxon 414]|uniref:Fpg/Nei family DNA glycosylase n=1 Tax=Actinomyces sp. oral taxon 414 TaxID=712122 RepID=UPI0006B02434|nr:DNA-formamidopyrimidine glycosylase family protein [Actinomyces sp. oral taxon 414]ALC98742.1 DNA lyase [Actinomyces sp. oral taxon 414]
MPEGHTIHRLAAALSELYAGRRLAVSSPQGRFAAGAARLNGQVLLDARAHGKHLFLPFAPAADLPLDDDAVVWLRIHLGLYGAWTFDGDAEFTAPHAIGAPRRRVGERGEHPLRHGGGSALSGLSGGEGDAGAPAPGLWEPPEPRGAVRLRLAGEHGVADLTGPAACELLDAEGLAAVRRRLGPDPLRDDGDIEVFVAGVRRRRRPIGELLMDQSVISGVGNIFRAETLLRCGVSPFRAGDRLSADRVRSLWRDLVPLMEYGVATGFITTVEAADVPDPLPEGDEEAARWYVYHRAARPCLRCGAPVRERTVAGRRLFWCAACQR